MVTASLRIETFCGRCSHFSRYFLSFSYRRCGYTQVVQASILWTSSVIITISLILWAIWDIPQRTAIRFLWKLGSSDWIVNMARLARFLTLEWMINLKVLTLIIVSTLKQTSSANQIMLTSVKNSIKQSVKSHNLSRSARVNSGSPISSILHAQTQITQSSYSILAFKPPHNLRPNTPNSQSSHL